MQTVAVSLVCAYVHMVVDPMNERRSGVCEANSPLILGSACHPTLPLVEGVRPL